MLQNIDDKAIEKSFNIRENENSISVEITVEVFEKVGIKEKIDI